MGETDLGRSLSTAQGHRFVVDLAEDRPDDLDGSQLLVAELDELLAEAALRRSLQAPGGQRGELLGLDAQHEPAGPRRSGSLAPEDQRRHSRAALQLNRLDAVADPSRRGRRGRADVYGKDPTRQLSTPEIHGNRSPSGKHAERLAWPAPLIATRRTYHVNLANMLSRWGGRSMCGPELPAIG